MEQIEAQERGGRPVRRQARLPVRRTQPRAQAREVRLALLVQADELAIEQQPTPPQPGRQLPQLRKRFGAVAPRARTQTERAAVEPELSAHTVELHLVGPALGIRRHA
jgi:hypothetical protein